MSMWNVDIGRWVLTFQLSFNSFLGKDRVEFEQNRGQRVSRLQRKREEFSKLFKMVKAKIPLKKKKIIIK